MSRKLIILMGIGRSGKSTFAKKLKTDGYKRISIDGHFKYNQGIQPWHDFVDYLVDTLNSSGDRDFVLDGFINACTDKKIGYRIYTGHGFKYIQERLKYHEIKPVVVVESVDTIHARSRKMSKPVEDRERIVWLYAWFLTMRGIGTAVLGSKDNPVISSREKAMSLVLGKEESITPTKVGSKHILKRLKRRKVERAPHHGDPYYQTIELNDGFVVKGYNGNNEHKTWKIISKFLKVKDKTVAEVGAHHGFYLLKMKELGAKIAQGFDFNPWTVESANQIAHFREIDVNHTLLDIDKENLPMSYDIILVMNTDHHFHDPKGSLRKIFTKAREHVLFETRDNNRFVDGSNYARLATIAKEQGFRECIRADSKRKKRVILMYEKV